MAESEQNNQDRNTPQSPARAAESPTGAEEPEAQHISGLADLVPRAFVAPLQLRCPAAAPALPSLATPDSALRICGWPSSFGDSSRVLWLRAPCLGHGGLSQRATSLRFASEASGYDAGRSIRDVHTIISQRRDVHTHRRYYQSGKVALHPEPAHLWGSIALEGRPRLHETRYTLLRSFRTGGPYTRTHRHTRTIMQHVVFHAVFPSPRVAAQAWSSGGPTAARSLSCSRRVAFGRHDLPPGWMRNPPLAPRPSGSRSPAPPPSSG